MESRSEDKSGQWTSDLSNLYKIVLLLLSRVTLYRG